MKQSMSKLESIKEKLDHAASRADYDELAKELDKMVHNERLAHDPRLAGEELKNQRKVEAKILVNRMKARVDAMKEARKPGGRHENTDPAEFRRALSRAEEDLAFAEDQLSKV